MEIRQLDRDNLPLDNGLRAQRLFPWAALNAPFEGSWCVVPPGVASGPHAHHEYEVWIAMTGEAVIVCEGEEVPFTAGDVVHFRPGLEHQVVNQGEDDFQMYAVWWDAELAGRFATRHQEESA
ncbi:Cupin domain protein [Streptomyces sp. ADI96-15]|uniref:cupin domain-containing protein n=1 Tax=Streptomyces TaxID=1883 RepID=UPI000316E721|nr:MULTISPECIES: cupin domain-containing protein [Streptomyces]QOZ99990.1 cupin domain-containing protein [Streptomyces violascens]ESP99114.1 cupin [Streptomyces sp. GBA 94-10 4N24]ESQ04942.1 cupin [Streptomyces sp. PVA_94-07]MBP3078181.1 cupin [Streptomyces sp. 604F]QHV86702.1 cupin domain-containing protein [Streptomyces sp. 604F]